MLTAPDQVEGVPMLTAPDSTEGVPMLTAPKGVPIAAPEGVPMLTASEVPMLTAPDSTEVVPLLTALNPTTESVAFLAAPDLTEGVLNLTERVAVAALDRTASPGSEDDYKIRPNYHVGAADWSRGTAISSESSTFPTSKETSRLSSYDKCCQCCQCCALASQRRLLTPEGIYLNPRMASYYVLSSAGPLAGPAGDENCPSPSGRSAEERHLNPGPLGTLDGSQSLTTPGSAAYCLPAVLRPSWSTTGSNASVTRLSHARLHPPHRRVLHVALVLIQEPRERS